MQAYETIDTADKPSPSQRYDHLSREELIALVESRRRDHARIGLN